MQPLANGCYSVVQTGNIMAKRGDFLQGFLFVGRLVFDLRLVGALQGGADRRPVSRQPPVMIKRRGMSGIDGAGSGQNPGQLCQRLILPCGIGVADQLLKFIQLCRHPAIYRHRGIGQQACRVFIAVLACQADHICLKLADQIEIGRRRRKRGIGGHFCFDVGVEIFHRCEEILFVFRRCFDCRR